MAELNRQVLINLHNNAGVPTAAQLEYGEIAVVHSDVTTATIYTKVGDDTVAKFITDLAVDAKIKPVADELTAHKTAYGLKVSELENADNANAQAITAETQARESADAALGERLTTVETLLGDSDTDGSILDRLSDVETKVDENAQAISTEAETRAAEDGKLSTAIENMDAAYKAADTQIRADFAAADTQIRADFAAADTQIREDFAAADADLLGKDSDESDAETIWGAKNAAADALTAAQNAQTDATQALTNAAAAQATADEAKGKIDTFLLDADLTDKAVDTLREIQNYITSDGEAAADMLEAIEANRQAAADAQKAADDAQTHSEGVASNLAAEIDRAKAAEKANADAITAETQARESADAGLLGASGDAVSAVTIWGAKNAAAAAQETADQGVQDAADALTAAQNAQGHSEGVASDLAAEIDRAKAAEKANADAITAETQARESADAALKGTSGDAASAETIWGAKNAAAAAQEDANTNKTNLENLSAVVVKTAEITGVGLGRTETITGLVSGNKLTFDFSNLVIDCGTF